ncbi:MAG: cytidine deaminase [Clostridia bacterium]|nr:cytidine deaminase [Clostridia bacterium]
MSTQELLSIAHQAMQNAYVPYSHHAVGAALLGESGRVYLGCNVENAAYSPSCCAERIAFYKAVSEGERRFRAIAVVGGINGRTEHPCPPCGVCRQVMREFCDPEHFRIILGCKDEETYLEYTLAQLLPESFGPQNLL